MRYECLTKIHITVEDIEKMLYKDLDDFKSKYTAFKLKYEKKDTFETTDLCKILDKNRSDKSYPLWAKDKVESCKKMVRNKERSFHNYSLFYHEFFSHVRHENISIFEVGMGSNNSDVRGFMGENARPGASLYAWSEYFKNGLVYGADIDPRIMFEDTEARIKTYCFDQASRKGVEKAFSDIEDKVDIIIDDGLHFPDYNMKFFENAFDHLRDGGLFVIEDLFLGPHSQNFNQKHRENLQKIKKKCRFADILTLSSTFNKNDNNLLVILK